jgi:hypothetical protein
LRAFGDILGDTSRLQARDASQVGTIGSFKRGSSAVLPLELDEANHAGDGMKVFGDLLGGFGGIATSAGLSGGKLPFLTGGAAKTVTTTPVASIAAARALDRASVPGYSVGLPLSSLYGAR